MRLATLKTRRNVVGAAVLMWIIQSQCGMAPAVAQSATFGAQSGEVVMEETTAEKDPKLTWKVLRRALERVRQGRLDEAEDWLMYAMRNASSDPLLEAVHDREYLAKGLSVPSAKGSSLSAEDGDVRVLQALIQTRFGSHRQAAESLRFIEKNCPTYSSMNQVKSRIRALDKSFVPAPQNYMPEPRELSQKEYQEILERIARDKVSLSENQKTITQALLEANEDILEKHSRWRANRFPLKVFVPTDASCLKIPGYIAGDRNSLTESFQLWQKTMKEQIKFVFVDSAAKADITCAWVDHPDKLGIKAKDVVGTCSKTFEGSFAIAHAEIRMLTASSRRAQRGPAFRGKFLRSVALHEIGHALGLDHLPNERSIMYFQVSDPLVETLAADDISTMQEIVVATRKDAERIAKTAGMKQKIDAAKSNMASASARIKADESTIRHLVTNVDSQLKAAKDLESFNMWEQACAFYEDAFRYRPSDDSIRQNICRTANNAGRVALKKERKTQAVKFLSRGRELMNKTTPVELRQQILENLRQAYEANNQQAEAAEVQAVLQSGSF